MNETDPMVLGWREWVALPDLGVPRIKAKMDTGARTSSLHVTDMAFYEKHGQSMVRFRIHPQQRSSREAIDAQAEVHEHRKIKSSSGHSAVRPVILTRLQVGNHTHVVELTLANRKLMGFRLLIGRQAMRGHYTIDSSKSFLSKA